MKFFKHFCDAHRGKSLRGIRRKLGVAGIGMYWIIVELCGEKLEKEESELFDESHCVFEFDLKHFCNELGIKPKRLENILRTFSEHSLFVPECSEDIVKIKMPKLLESLDRDSRRARQERGPDAPKIKKKIKIKNKKETGDEPPAITPFGDILKTKTVGKEIQDSWIETYVDVPWIEFELRKSMVWCLSNKGPKSNFARFFSQWLATGWESHRKTLAIKPRSTICGIVKE